MSVACVIPARYNSSRFPGKLLAKVNGKTIIQRTFENAALCTDLDALFVATDHEQIKEHVQSFGGKVLWTSSTPKNGTERIIEALRTYPVLQNVSYILNVQGDHPCTSPETMRKVIDALRSHPEAILSTAATPIKEKKDFLSPHVVKCVFDQTGSALYFSRAPIPYNAPESAFAHIGIYCYKKDFIFSMDHSPSFLQQVEGLEQLGILERGYRIQITLVDEKGLGVDTFEDLLTLEEYLC
jgi:3-deoxy-manno-octulosonate cytidylyltransferase (CMP-KDO synthetase)